MSHISDTDTNTDVESEYDEDDDDIVCLYDPEEPSITKFNIVFCRLYNEKMFGETDEEIKTHFLVMERIKYYTYINGLLGQFRVGFYGEIAHCIYLPSQHCVAILKTFWLRIIQRTWKRVFREKQEFIRKRCSLNCIKYNEVKKIYNPYMPCLKGMLARMALSRS